MKPTLADQVRAYIAWRGDGYTPAKLADDVAAYQKNLPRNERCKRQNIEQLLEKNFKTVRYGVALAKAMGTTAETLAAGRFQPAASQPTSVASIADDDSAVPPGYMRLEHLSPVPTMGPGASIDEPVTVLQYVDVLEQWVRERVGTPNPARIKILTARGSSMRGTIQDQDIVFVDITQQSIDAPGIYVLDVAGRFLLKRALIQGNGTLILRSDNVDEYPDEERYDLAKYAAVIHVAGRVCAWWTLRRP